MGESAIATTSSVAQRQFLRAVGGTLQPTGITTNNFTLDRRWRASSTSPPVGTGGTVTRTSGVPVTDATLPTAGDTRNYTVMQVKGPKLVGQFRWSGADYLLYASQVRGGRDAGSFNGIAGTYTATGGDYFARNVPWNPSVNNAACDPTVVLGGPSTPACATANSAPNGRPVTFSGADHAVVRFVPHPVLRQQQPDQDAAAPDGATGARGSTRGRTTPCSTTSTGPSRAGTA